MSPAKFKRPKIIVTPPVPPQSASRRQVIKQGLAALATLPNDTPTRLKGKTGTVKCVAWSEPIDLVRVKDVGYVLGCSVNDVLLASVAGARACWPWAGRSWRRESRQFRRGSAPLLMTGSPPPQLAIRDAPPCRSRAPGRGEAGTRSGCATGTTSGTR